VVSALTLGGTLITLRDTKKKRRARKEEKRKHSRITTDLEYKEKRARRKKEEGLKVHRLFEEEVCFNLVR